MEYVDEAIRALPELQKNVVVGHFLEHRTHAAIAQDLGVTRQAVSYRLNQGVKSIREHLRRKGVDIPIARLGAMLLANLSEAAPASLLTSLSKVGLTGIVNGHPHAAPMTVKTPVRSAWAVAVVVVCTVLIAWVGMANWPQSDSPKTSGAGTAPAAARSSGGVSPATPSPGPADDTPDSASLSPKPEGLHEATPVRALKPLGSYEGIVVDTSDKPISGAAVRAMGADVSGHTQSNSDGTFRLEVQTFSDALAAEVIGEDGDSVPFTVVALKGGYQQIRRDKGLGLGDFPIRLILGHAGAIRGKVVREDTGEPIPNFMVRMTNAYGIPGWDDPWTSYASADGTFELPTRSNVSLFQVRARGCVTEMVELQAPEGEITTDVVIALKPGREVQGIVLDGRTGEPVSGAQIGVGRGHFHRWKTENYPFAAESGADGRFVLTDCPASAQVSLIAYHPDYAPECIVDYEPNESETLTVRLSHGHRLAGQIMSGHTAFPRPLVLITNAFGEAFDSLATSPELLVYEEIGDIAGDGSFEFPGVPKGRYRVSIKYIAGFPRQYEGVLGERFPIRAWATVESDRETFLPIDFDSWGFVSGAVAFEGESQPVSVSLYDRRYPREPLFYTDEGHAGDFALNENGTFLFGSVPPGAYTIQAVAHSAPKQILVEHAMLSEGADLHFDLVFK
jgi:hypothetical protein